MTVKSKIHNEYTERVKAGAPTEDLEVAQRSAWVVGASPGNVGEAVHHALAERYGSVTSTSRSDVDALSYMGVERFLGQHGPFDTLVTCVGTTHMDWIEDMPPATTVDVLTDTLVAPIRLTEQFVRNTIGFDVVKRILYIGSVARRKVVNGSSVYCAAKAGLSHYADCAAWELTPKGYRIMSVHPCNIAGTPMTEAVIDDLVRFRELDDRQQAEEYWASDCPLDHQLTPDEIARVVADLLCSPVPYLSGVHVELRGGQR